MRNPFALKQSALTSSPPLSIYFYHINIYFFRTLSMLSCFVNRPQQPAFCPIPLPQPLDLGVSSFFSDVYSNQSSKLFRFKPLHTLFLNEHSATLFFSAGSTLSSSQQRGMRLSRSGSCLTPLQSAVTRFSTSNPFAICTYRKGSGGYVIRKNVSRYRRSSLLSCNFGNFLYLLVLCYTYRSLEFNLQAPFRNKSWQ